MTAGKYLIYPHQEKPGDGQIKNSQLIVPGENSQQHQEEEFKQI
jgi:hypothetical protein